MDAAGHAWILASAEHQHTVLVWHGMCDGFLQVSAGRRQRAKIEPRHSEGIVGEDSQRGVVSTLRQAQQRFAEFLRRVQLWPCHIIPLKSKQDWD